MKRDQGDGAASGFEPCLSGWSPERSLELKPRPFPASCTIRVGERNPLSILGGLPNKYCPASALGRRNRSCRNPLACAILGKPQMANTYSALKRVRQTERRTEFNRKAKSRLRHQIRSMRRALQDKDAKKAGELMPQTFSIIDRAAKSGLIKKNTAARYKSKLHVRVKALAQ